MGIIKQGILGALSGKVGNVVGASWKGIDYLRALPSQVANPNTIGQQTTRSKMRLVVKFLKSCTALVRIGFSGFAVRMSAFNAATSYNLGNAISGDYPAIALDYPSVTISRGNLTGALNPLAQALEAGKVTFTWTDNSGTGTAKATDVAMLLVYNPAKQVSVYATSAAPRSAGTAVVDVPADWATDEVQCYIGFSDESRMIGNQLKDSVSNSSHAGVVLLP